MALAQAIIEYIHFEIGAKTFFSTHYHELTILENELDGVKNYNIAAKKRGDEIIFLRKIVRGSADDSYGIEVAKLAGIPKNVVKRAREILSDLEAGTTESPVATATDTTQVSMADINALAVAQQLRKTDLNTLTPLEAMNLLYDLKNKL